MTFFWIVLLLAVVIRTATSVLAEITLPAPAADPPTMFPVALSIRRPWLLFPIAEAPVTSVPTKLPCTVWPEPPEIRIPVFEFPETILRAAAEVPPTVTPVAPCRLIPKKFGRAAVPDGFVPIRFPWIRLPLAVLETPMPEAEETTLELPEITLPAPAVVAPTDVLRAR